jgi:hypothetical protein
MGTVGGRAQGLGGKMAAATEGECLKNFKDLKVGRSTCRAIGCTDHVPQALETALNIRVAAMKELTAALNRHPIENPLVNVLQPSVL